MREGVDYCRRCSFYLVGIKHNRGDETLARRRQRQRRELLAASGRCQARARSLGSWQVRCTLHARSIPSPLQAEEGITAIKELCHAAKAKENREFGAFIAASAASMMVAWYFLPPDGRGAYNMRYIIPMFLGLACVTSGLSLMLLSQNILDLQEDLVVDVQLVASKWLYLLCSILPVLTLLSSLVLSGYKVYRYIGLIILGLVLTPLALLRWYIGRNVEGSGEQVDNEHKEELEAAFKFISAISNSAFGGLVALAVNYNITGYSGHTKGAVLVAIFILFTTAILGLLSMGIQTKLLEINNSRLRGSIIKAMWFIIIFMLLLLAGAALQKFLL